MDEFEDASEVLATSIQNIVDSKTLKWVFVGGKGGVGKTTTACSVAALLAQTRESVLLLSTDPAHNTSDAWCQKFGSTPTQVNGIDNLFVMELDAASNSKNSSTLLKKDGMAEYMRDMVQSFPGVDEAMGFAELMESVQTMQYSVIVFDTAPTGHTLRLLGFPQLIEKGLGKLSGVAGTFSSLVQMMNSMSGQNHDSEDIMSKVNKMLDTTRRVQDIFQNPELTTFVCVCIPEFLSVYETERLVQELARFGIDTSNIVVNQVLFHSDDKCTECRMCSARRKMQRKYLDQILELYGEDFHVSYIPQLLEEVRGHAALKDYGSLLLRTDTP